MESAKVIAICNQKGGVGKTATSVCLGVTLANQGKKVLLVDFDPQGNLTKGFGYRDKTAYPYSIKDVLLNEVFKKKIDWHNYILNTSENVDIIPSNIDLSKIDLQLASAMSRENLLKRFLVEPKKNYDYIIIDGNPSLNLFTINTLTAAGSVIIPVQAEPYATDGLVDLLYSINQIREELNPNLEIDGIVLTMTDARTNLSKHIVSEIRDLYGDSINVFKTIIPRSVKAAESVLAEQSPIKYAPQSEASKAYANLTKEVLERNGEGITKARPKLIK